MDTLTLETRRKIYQIILKHPGIHLREIQRKLDMATGMLTYHLGVLEETGFIRSETKEGKKCYFPYTFPYSDRRIILLLREKIARSIVLFLIERPHTFSELVKKTGRSKSVVSTSLSRLRDGGVVKISTQNDTNYYELSDPDKIKKMFITYKESFYDDAVDRFVELWLEI